MIKYSNIIAILLASTLCFGCLAKSKHVDELTIQHYDLVKKLSSDNPEDETLRNLKSDAYVLAKDSSSVISNDAIDKLSGFVGGFISKLIGFDVSGIMTGLLGVFGVGGAVGGTMYSRKKKRQLKAVAKMNPADAEKIEEII